MGLHQMLRFAFGSMKIEVLLWRVPRIEAMQTIGVSDGGLRRAPSGQMD
jgi:hypothetical protein